MEESTKINKNAYLVVKRILDILIGVIGFILSIPFVFIFSLLICLESSGSPIYVQDRVGLNGKEFKIYKLRSMRSDAEKNGPKWADENDSRVTKVGEFIRKVRIDELPQFYNVLKGDMSIVGPRPERQVFIDEFLEYIPNFNDRLLVKPGITGYAQVNGGYDITPEEKLELDIQYIEKFSFKQDCSIMFLTIKTVLTGEGAR